MRPTDLSKRYYLSVSSRLCFTADDHPPGMGREQDYSSTSCVTTLFGVCDSRLEDLYMD